MPGGEWVKIGRPVGQVPVDRQLPVEYTECPVCDGHGKVRDVIEALNPTGDQITVAVSYDGRYIWQATTSQPCPEAIVKIYIQHEGNI